MKQKIWSRAAALVMTICMAITMVPSTAWAAGISQRAETRYESLILVAGGNVNSPVSDTEDEDQGWKWEKSDSTLGGSGTLTLSNVDFQIPSEKVNSGVRAGVCLPTNTTVVLEGTNTITLTGRQDGDNDLSINMDAIFGKGITFIGSGTLEIKAQPTDSTSYTRLQGIDCSGTLTIGDGNSQPTITVIAGTADNLSQGILAEKLSLQSGSLTATGGQASTSYGIYTRELLNIAKDFAITASTASGATTKEACYFGYGQNTDYTNKTAEDHTWSKQSIEDSMTGGTVTEKTDGVHVTQTGSEPVGIQYKGDISKAQSDSLDFTSVTENKSGTGWSWDNERKTLTLNGLNLTVKSGTLVGEVNKTEGGILLPAGATIVLADNTVNTVNMTAAHSADSDVNAVTGIYMSGDLTIKGNGKLVVDVKLPETVTPNYSLALRGIGTIGCLTIGTGTDKPIIEATAGNASSRSAGIDMVTAGSLKLLSGEITVKSGNQIGTNDYFMSFGINGTLTQINNGFKVTASCGTGDAYSKAACSFALSGEHSWTEDGFTKSLSNGTAEATQWDLQLKQTDSSQPLTFTYGAGGSTPVDPTPQPETNALDLSGATEDKKGNGWSWDNKNNILTLTNANFNLNSGVIKTKEESGILLPDDAVIVLIGKNTLALFGPSNNTINEFCAIRATKLKIIGNGSLDITITQNISSVPETLMMRGISSGSLEIGSDSNSDSPKITVNTEATKTYSTMGIYARNLSLKKGSLTANVGYSGILASTLAEIADGFSITASYTERGGYACKFGASDSDGHTWTVDKIKDSLTNGSGTVSQIDDEVTVRQTETGTPVNFVYQDTPAEPEAVTITGLTVPEKTYDGNAITNEAFGVPEVKKDGEAVKGVVLTYTYNTEDGTAPTNAGTYQVTVALADSMKTKYTCDPVVIDFTIAKKNASIWMNFPIVKVGTTWGAVKQEIEPLTSEGFVNEAEETAIEAQLSYRLSNDAGEVSDTTALNTAGEYYYVVDPAETENYQITYNGCNFIVSEEYTVNFVTNGGTAVEPQKKLLYDTISLEKAPTRAGYQFAGWYTDSAFANVWALEDDKNSGDVVLGNMTLYAKWVEDGSLVDYTVIVSGTDSASDVTVKLKQGGTTLYQETAGTDGKAAFTGVVPGTYTLEVEQNGKYFTQVLTIPGDTSTTAVTMPENTSAELVVMWSAPAVLADGLNDEAQNIKTQENATSVDFFLRVEGKDETELSKDELAAIEAKTSGQQRMYLDAQAWFKIDNAEYTERSETTKVLELIVPFDMTGKNNLGVCRYHDTSAALLQQVQKGAASYADGQFYIDGNYIHIFTNKFSTYAIAYTTSNGGGTSSGGSSSGSSYGVDVPAKTEGGSVAVSPKNATKGTTVTVTVTPDQGYTLKDLTVLDKDGQQVQLTEKDGKYTFTMPAGKVSVQASFAKEAPAQSFTDVPATAYYYDAVQWAAEKGITGGVGDGRFAPEQGCTRGQIVTFLWRTAGSPEPNALSTYTDVPADAYYAKAVAWAVENGITVGTSETTFSPDMTCTRAHGVTFLYRAAKAESAAASTAFTDVDANAYYASAVNWAVENGITNGVSSTLFGPDGTCTRAQIVTFLYRAYNK